MGSGLSRHLYASLSNCQRPPAGIDCGTPPKSPGQRRRPDRASRIGTNVFIGACLGTGAASSVVRACLQGEVQPLVGVALLAEYEDVLARDEVMAACRLS